MNRFSLHLKTRVEFGQGVISSVGREASAFGKRALFLYGQGSIKKNGIYDTVVQSCIDHGISLKEHPGAVPNPVISHAFSGAQAAREFQADVIIAVGGGSVVDEAKCIALAYYTSSTEELWQYYLRKKTAQQALPIIAVMTMPATSSEMNGASVMINDETKEKFSTRSQVLVPEVALLDPSVTLDIPLHQTAYAAADIMSHVLEGFFTRTDPFSPVQEELSLGLMSASKQSMDKILDDPRNFHARSSLMWAASLAWNGLASAGWEGARIPCHTLEHPLSGLYDLPHGAGLSITIPAYLTLRREKYADRLAVFGRRVLGLNEVHPDSVIDGLKQWYRKIQTPSCFHEWPQVPSFDINLLVQHAEELNRIWQNSDFEPGEIRRTYELMAH